MRQSMIVGPVLVALTAGTLAAQTASSTLPTGWDSKEGIEVGTTNASQYWVGFDLGSSSTASYNPAKALYLYDSSLFPWDPKKAQVITKLSFRRDGAADTATAHSREWVVIMSTTSVHPANCNYNLYEGNHGKDRTEVFGTVGKPGIVKFGATAAPKAPATAPFDVVVTLDKSFIVPADTKTLVIEIRSYKVSGATSGWWRADSVTYPGSKYVGSSYTLINSDHCVTPSVFFTSRLVTPGSNFVHVFRTAKAPGGDPYMYWLGLKATTPFLFPGTKCNVHVLPVVYPVYGKTEKSGSYALVADFGLVPPKTTLVGRSVSHQGLFLNSSYPAGIAFTRAGTTKVGSGYDSTETPGVQIYSYGANSTMYHPVVDPEKEIYARYLYRRVVIIKIN